MCMYVPKSYSCCAVPVSPYFCPRRGGTHILFHPHFVLNLRSILLWCPSWAFCSWMVCDCDLGSSNVWALSPFAYISNTIQSRLVISRRLCVAVIVYGDLWCLNTGCMGCSSENLTQIRLLVLGRCKYCFWLCCLHPHPPTP